MNEGVIRQTDEQPSVAEALLDLLAGDGLPVSEPHPCPYLPVRFAREQGFLSDQLDGEVYHELMALGFRRSGRVYYRPACEACQACVPLRIDVHAFQPSRSQRRVQRRNRDVTVRVGPPDMTDEKVRLYRQYLHSQHPGSEQGDSADDLEQFLYRSPITTLEVTYHDVDLRLIGASLIDLSTRSVSSVYHFFDPREARRSLGVFSVLTEIDLCKRWEVPHYYLGYWVAGAPTMDYKADYRPHEVLIDGQWVRRDKRPTSATVPRVG